MMMMSMMTIVAMKILAMMMVMMIFFAKAIQAEGWLHFNYLFNFDIGLCANCKGAAHTILGKQKIFHFELNQNYCYSIKQGGRVK